MHAFPCNIILLSQILLQDLCNLEQPEYNNVTHIEKAIKWIYRAQDSTIDGGVSEGYHLFYGWLPSYPETTGYIIETLFDYFHFTGDESARSRAIKMTDWLVSIQNDNGSISDSYFKRKMVFDTGQVIFGLVRCYKETGIEQYLVSANNAGEWLVREQDDDGAWRRHAVDEIPHTYYSRVAWSLLKLHQLLGDADLIDSAKRNISWTLQQQKANGWFSQASFNLSNHKKPYTHTIAYTLRGILESGIYLKEDFYIDSVKKAMDSFIVVLPVDGRIPGSYNENWDGDYGFSCLTGNAQLAIVLFRLYEVTHNQEYLFSAKRINAYLKSKQQLRNADIRVHGAIAGSVPIWGEYIHYAYPNWAVKFFIDSLLLENKLIGE
jgi:uncharacterized protein YyaL (SSP411 family)